MSPLDDFSQDINTQFDFSDQQLVFWDTPDTVLHRECDLITQEEFESGYAKALVEFLLQKTQDMHAAGFAANQFGIDKKVFTFNVTKEFATKCSRKIIDNNCAYKEDKALLAEKLVEIGQKIEQNNSDDMYFWENGYMINPKIDFAQSTPVDLERIEGCFSDPENKDKKGTMSVYKVLRSPKIMVDYLDWDGHAHQIIANDFLAFVIQHEMRHLEGSDISKDYTNLEEKHLYVEIPIVEEINR